MERRILHRPACSLIKFIVILENIENVVKNILPYVSQ
jgi:hypothetical protein